MGWRLSSSHLGNRKRNSACHRGRAETPGDAPMPSSPAELRPGAMAEDDVDRDAASSQASPCGLQPQGRLPQPQVDEASQREGVLGRVRSLVEAVVAWVHEEDGLFTREVLLAGSYAQGLHVQGESSASDVDFVIPLDYQVKLQVIGTLNKDPPGDFRSLLPKTVGTSSVVSVFFRNNKLLLDFDRLLEDHFDGDLFADGSSMTNKQRKDALREHCLDPKQVLVRFRTRIIKFFKSDPAWERLCQDSEGNTISSWGQSLPYRNSDEKCEVTILHLKKYCPAVQLRIQWGDKQQPLSVDLVPIIKNPFYQWPSNWPRQEVRWVMEWANGRRRKEADWKLQKIQEVYGTWIYLVSKEVWRLNFPCAETVLIEGIDADGGHRRDALKLLKLTNKVSWIKKYGKVLTSFHLKAILLWSCDLNPGPENWMNMSQSMETLLKTLHYSLETELLPHYFLPSVNLFKAKQVDLEMVEQRELGLRYVLEEVKVMQVSPFLYMKWEIEKNIEASQTENISAFEERLQGLHKSRTCYTEEYQQQFPEVSGTRKLEEMLIWNSLSDTGEVLKEEYSWILKEILPLDPGKKRSLEKVCPSPPQYTGPPFSACQYDFYDPEDLDDEQQDSEGADHSDYDNYEKDYDHLGDYEQDNDLEYSMKNYYMNGDAWEYEDRDDFEQHYEDRDDNNQDYENMDNDERDY